MMNRRREYLAVFDLDGTLFDTGEVNYCSYREALQPYGIQLDHTYFVEQCNGRHYTEFLPSLMKTDRYLEEVHAAKKDAYRRNLDKAGKNRHLFQMISQMRGCYYTAVVTTASRKNAGEILEHFACGNLFDYLVTQEDVSRAKPDPEGFQKAMGYFGMDAGHTVIFEDSDAGIAAARATGASVFVIDTF